MRLRGFAVVLAALVLGGCVSPGAPPPAAQSLQSAYEKSIALAAVKSPDYVRPLTPIAGNEATVAHVQPYESIDSSRYVWVAHPDELKAHCLGKPDPVLALQVALGLPPQAEPAMKVFTFTVRS